MSEGKSLHNLFINRNWSKTQLHAWMHLHRSQSGWRSKPSSASLWPPREHSSSRAVQPAVYFPSVYSRTVCNLTGFEWKLRTSAADWEEKLSRDSTRARLLCSRVCTLALTQESRALLEIWVVIHKSRLIYGHLAERARTHTHRVSDCCCSNSFLALHIYYTQVSLKRAVFHHRATICTAINIALYVSGKRRLVLFQCKFKHL